MKETAVHSRTVEKTHSTRVAVRKDGFRAVAFRQGGKAGGNRVEGFVPRYPFEAAFALRAGAAQRMSEALRVVLALEILSYLAAEKTASDGMVWIATKSGGATAIVNFYEKRASVRTI